MKETDPGFLNVAHFDVVWVKRLLYTLTIFSFPTSLVGYVVVQVVEALRYKPEDRRFDSRWCHWNFSLT